MMVVKSSAGVAVVVVVAAAAEAVVVVYIESKGGQQRCAPGHLALNCRRDFALVLKKVIRAKRDRDPVKEHESSVCEPSLHDAELNKVLPSRQLHVAQVLKVAVDLGVGGRHGVLMSAVRNVADLSLERGNPVCFLRQSFVEFLAKRIHLPLQLTNLVLPPLSALLLLL